MFSSAVSVGIRLKVWNTNPIESRRIRVSCFSEQALISTSPRKICPDVTRSRPARQCSRVDFPDPDGPMIAVYRWRSNSTSIPSSARTSASPEP